MILHLTDTSDDPWQHLFGEIVVWRHFSHPNVLPVLGVSPKLFPLCIVSEWMTNGNIMDFTSEHPEVNRLRLVRSISASLPQFLDPEVHPKLSEAASGLHYLHSMEVIHGNLKPVRATCDLYWPSLTIPCRRTSSSTTISALASPTTDSP